MRTLTILQRLTTFDARRAQSRGSRRHQGRAGELPRAVQRAKRGDGSSVFDRLFEDGEAFRIAQAEARVVHTPEHAPVCVTYVVSDAALVGDTLFMPGDGTVRADFPGGDAATLYRPRRGFLSVKATYLKVGVATHGRRRWRMSALRTSMCTTASRKTSREAAHGA